MTKKKPAKPIPETEYDRFKYRLEELSSEEHAKRNIILFQLGVATGYRADDIVDLTIGQIRDALKNERFVIQEKKQYKSYLTHMKKYPNSKKKPPEPREAVIKSKLRKLLIDYIKGRNNSEYAFLSNKVSEGKHITAKSYSNILKECGESLYLQNISGHSMRKTYASRLWEAKRDLEYVRIALNHTNVETTKRYLGLGDEVKSDAAKIVDDKL